jgi:ATP-binding protein involved in chromosome partitioning
LAHTGSRSEIFSPARARHEAERLGIEFLGELPLDLRIRETSDGGTPITVAEPDNPHAVVSRRMAARIWDELAGADGERSPPPRIVIEYNPARADVTVDPDVGWTEKSLRAQAC